MSKLDIVLSGLKISIEYSHDYMSNFCKDYISRFDEPQILAKAEQNAILKERSPACGSGKIYDGTFTKTLTDGNGIAAALLEENGIHVIGETKIFSNDLS